jgi:hypothetical protein
VHVASLKILTSLLGSFHCFDPIHQGRNKGIFIIQRVLWSGGGFHRLDSLFGSGNRVGLLWAVSGKMTHLVTVETGTLLHVFLSFAIGHVLTGIVGLGLSSVNVHRDIFIVGLLWGGSGGRQSR